MDARRDRKRSEAFQKEMTDWVKTLVERNGSKGVNEEWKEFSVAVVDKAEKTIGYHSAERAKKPWVTQAMLKKMDERREWKRINTAEGRRNYKWLNNQLRRETEKAREDWWKEECRELEDLDQRGRSDLMYKKIKEITRTGRSTSNIDVGG